MKKVIVIICALVLVSFKIDTTKEVEGLLTSGKWFVESTQEKGQEPEMVTDKNEEWILFSKEGKIQESIYGEITNASWEYIAKDNSIKITGDKVAYKKIIELTSTKLTVELLDVDSSSLMITYTK